MLWAWCFIFLGVLVYRTLWHNYGLFVGEKRVVLFQLLFLILILEVFPIAWWEEQSWDIYSGGVIMACIAQFFIVLIFIVFFGYLTFHANGQIRIGPSYFAAIWYYWRQILKYNYVLELKKENTLN